MNKPINRLLSEQSWSELGVPENLVPALEARGYSSPLLVQAQTLPITLAGRDVIARSKTGTGKTVAFCLPMVAAAAGHSAENGPLGLILAPTRELALQGADELEALAPGRKVVRIYGGVGYGPQEKGLREKADFVVGTPGRMLDFLRKRTLRLDNVRVACLDEADEMLSMGFFLEVTTILNHLPKERQILLFSATVEERVRSLAGRYLNEPEEIFLSSDVELNEDVEHVLYETADGYPKVRQLINIIIEEQPKGALIFCNTKSDTSTVSRYLSRQGMDAEEISSALPQKQRERVMGRIKAGDLDFLVATDIAARGIDISDLSHVFNYSLPEDPAVYLHRTGRTGRAGKKGIAISFMGGREMATRRVLENSFGVVFAERTMPDRATADRLHAERLVGHLRSTAEDVDSEEMRAAAAELEEQPDRLILLATALRSFFLWDHKRRRRGDVAPRDPGEGVIDRLRKAAGSTAFEGYLGGVRLLEEQEDKQLLVESALAGFLGWEILAAERAKNRPSIEEQAFEDRPRRGGGRDRDRGPRRGGRTEGRRPEGRSGSRDGRRAGGRDERRARPAMSESDKGPPKAPKGPPKGAPSGVSEGGDAPANKRRRRRRRRPSERGEGPKSGES